MQQPPEQPQYPNQPQYPQQPQYPNQPNWQQTPPPQYQQPYGAPIPPPQPKKRKRGCLIGGIVTVVLVVVIIIAAAAANSGKGSTSNSPASTQASGQPTQAPQATATPSVHKVGDAVTLAGWTIQLNSAKNSSGGQFDTLQHAGDVFLEASITATNNTGKTQVFSSLLNLTLKDSSGQKYTETIVSDAPTPPDGNVSNGSKVKGTVSYEVPKSAKSFELDFLPDPLGGTDQVSWTFIVS